MTEMLAKSLSPDQSCHKRPVRITLPKKRTAARALGISYLSLSVLTGMRFLCQRMTGSGRPWIWHWNLATPPSSTTAFCGWTWKSDMAGRHKERQKGSGVKGEPSAATSQDRGSFPELGNGTVRHPPGRRAGCLHLIPISAWLTACPAFQQNASHGHISTLQSTRLPLAPQVGCQSSAHHGFWGWDHPLVKDKPRSG